MNEYKLLLTIFVVLGFTAFVFCDGTCEDTLTAVQHLVTAGRVEYFSGGEGNSSSRNGRPGKRGADGPPGPRGPKGEQGVCSCNLAEIVPQLQDLKDLIDSIKRSPGMCYMGLSTGKIKPTQISASSVYPHPICVVANGVLNSAKGWCAATNDENQWLQVDFLVPRRIAGVVTQGRADDPQWVKTFRVLYGTDASALQYYSEQGEPKVFNGNSDKNTIVENFFIAPITARYVRIQPLTYYRHVSMRIEMRQC